MDTRDGPFTISPAGDKEYTNRFSNSLVRHPDAHSENPS